MPRQIGDAPPPNPSHVREHCVLRSRRSGVVPSRLLRQTMAVAKRDRLEYRALVVIACRPSGSGRARSRTLFRPDCRRPVPGGPRAPPRRWRAMPSAPGLGGDRSIGAVNPPTSALLLHRGPGHAWCCRPARATPRLDGNAYGLIVGETTGRADDKLTVSIAVDTKHPAAVASTIHAH